MSKVTVNRGSYDGKMTSDGFKRIGESERMVSLVAGTTLAASAMRSRSFLGAAVLLGVSAGLLHRGATGKCGFAKGLNKLNRYVNVDNINEMIHTGYDKVSTKVSDQISDFKGERKTTQNNQKKDEVTVASKDSFPASDPPSFTPVTGEADSHS